MSDKACTYPGQREDVLMAYVYGEMTEAEREGFVAHLESCRACQTELSGFDAVRTTLAAWAPPDPRRTLFAGSVGSAASTTAPAPAARARRWAALHEMPVWAQAVAAVLVLGVAAGAANVRVTYGTEGLSIRTGWLSDGSGSAAVASAAVVPAAVPVQVPEPPITRAEFAALEQALRAEIDTAKDIQPSVIRETRAIVAASEKRQENELALRIGTMYQDMRVQRDADNVRFARFLGQVKSSQDIQAKQLQYQVSSLTRTVAQK